MRLIKYIFLYLLLVSFTADEKQSEWTVETLKQYVDQRFQSINEAVSKADVATEKRFESVNEWRNSYADLVRNYIPREEYLSGHEIHSQQIAEIKAKQEKIANMKAGGDVTFAYLVSGISMIVAIVALSKNFFSNIYKQK